MSNLKSISDKIDYLRNKLNNVNKSELRQEDVGHLLDKKVLTRDDFYSDDFMAGYVRCDSVEDISVGDFVRYKIKFEDGNVKYLWGGMVSYISPTYVSLKNVYTRKSWSVQLTKNYVVFYVKKRMTKDDVEAYTDLIRDDRRLVDLNTASSEGLIAEVIKRGDLRLILETAKLIAEDNQETMIL